MPADEVFQPILFFGINKGFQFHHTRITTFFELLVFIDNVGDSAAHACSKISSGRSEYHHPSAGHVFTTVISNSLYNGVGSAVADGETLSGDSPEKCFSGGGAIKNGVSNQDVFFRFEGRLLRGINDQSSAAEPFAGIVVGVSFQLQGYPLGKKSTEALACRSFKLAVHGSIGKS